MRPWLEVAMGGCTWLPGEYEGKVRFCFNGANSKQARPDKKKECGCLNTSIFSLLSHLNRKRKIGQGKSFLLWENTKSMSSHKAGPLQCVINQILI